MALKLPQMLDYHPISHLLVYWMILDEGEFKTRTELKEKAKKAEND